MLSSVINHSRREWGLSIANPVALVRKPIPGGGRNRVPDPGEEARLLDALKPRGRRNHWIVPIVVLALESAMRRGELLALPSERIDLGRRLACLPITKNGQSRVAPLSPWALDTLGRLARSSPEPGAESSSGNALQDRPGEKSLAFTEAAKA